MPLRERLERRRADVSGCFAIDAGRAQQVPRKRGHRRLAVRPGDRQHLGARTIAHLPREQLDIAQHRHRARERFAHDRLFERKSGADAQQIDSLQQRCAERSRDDFDAPSEIARARRRDTRVRDSGHPALRAHPTRDGQSGVSEPEHEHALAEERHGLGSRQGLEGRLAHHSRHLSFSVESPNSTSIIVMIQKRTTTWLSFQPSSS